MKAIRDAMGLLLAVSIALRLAAVLVAPAVPLVVAAFILISIVWAVLGRPGRRL